MICDRDDLGGEIMKKGKWAVLVLASVFLLTACGQRMDSTVTTGEMVVPEMSSEDLLVDSLEYLLQDEEKQGEDMQGMEALADDAKAGNKASVEIVVYYSNAACDGLDSQIEQAEEVTPDVLIAALARHNIVSLDTKVLSFSEEEQEEGKAIYLDLSTGMNHYLETMTREAKDIIIDSIASTFLENYQADIIQIQVGGKPLHRSVTLNEA